MTTSTLASPFMVMIMSVCFFFGCYRCSNFTIHCNHKGGMVVMAITRMMTMFVMLVRFVMLMRFVMLVMFIMLMRFVMLMMFVMALFGTWV